MNGWESFDDDSDYGERWEGAFGAGECVVLRKSPKALHVRLPSGQQAWVPFGHIFEIDSKLLPESAVDDRGRLVVSRWLATAKGWK